MDKKKIRTTIVSVSCFVLLGAFILLKPKTIEGNVSYKDIYDTEEGNKKMVIRIEYKDNSISDYTSNEYILHPNYWDKVNPGDSVKVSSNYFNTKVSVISKQ